MLLAVLLGLSILLYGVSHIVRHQVMDDGFYLDALEQQSVYDRIYQEILADPALADVVDPLLGNVPVVRSFLVSILRLVLPPERIREGAELVVAEWQLYLRGERDVWQPRIDLGGIDTNIVPFISSYVATRIATATGIEVASTAEFRRELESSFASLMQGDIPNAVPKLQPRNPSEAKALAGLMLSRAPVPVLPGAQDQIAAALMVGNVQEAFALAAPYYVDPALRNAVREWQRQLEAGFILDAIESFEATARQHSGTVAETLAPVRSTLRVLAAPLAFGSTATMLGALAGLLWVLPLQRRSRRRWLGIVFVTTGLTGVIALMIALAGFNQVIDDLLSRVPASFPPSLSILLRDVAGELSASVRDATLPALVGLVALGTLPLGTPWALKQAGLSLRLLRRYRSQAAASVVGTLGLFGVLVGSELAYLPFGRHDDMRCNGHRELCDRRVDEVVFAGTHNSMSAANLGWVFPHHDRGIPSQLAAGYRALLLDTHYWDGRLTIRPFSRKFPKEYGSALAELLARVDPPQPGTFLCHGVCALGATPLAEGLADIARFMRQNPYEVVILSLEDYIRPEDTYEAFRSSGLLSLVYTPDESGEWPTLRELIDRNERVIVLADHSGGEPDWYLPFWSHMQDTPFDFRNPSEFSCARNRGYADAPMLMINHWITRPPPDRVAATRVNQYDVLMERVEQCRQERGMEPTIIAVDFFSIGHVQRVVDDLNLRRDE